MEYTVNDILKECNALAYEFQNSPKKRLRGITIYFDNKTLEKIRAYRDIINEKSTAKTIKRLVTNSLKLWGK